MYDITIIIGNMGIAFKTVKYSLSFILQDVCKKTCNTMCACNKNKLNVLKLANINIAGFNLFGYLKSFIADTTFAFFLLEGG
jgi:hypothetical protein